MLMDSLWRLVSAPFSLLIDWISFSSLLFSSMSAFLDSRSVNITADLFSSCYCKRVADRFIRVILLCLKACFLMSTVFSSSICLRFISKILLLCFSSLSISRILALSWLIRIYFLFNSCSSFYTPFSLVTATSAVFLSLAIWALNVYWVFSSFSFWVAMMILFLAISFLSSATLSSAIINLRSDSLLLSCN